jgi:two-component system, sensor histidine kinase
MEKTSLLRHIKDISISRKLFFIVGTMAVLIMLELFTLWFAVHTLSSVRALVGAEGLWSKAEKDAVYSLNKYYRTHDEKDYDNFKNFMRVPLGDHKTRLELFKENMNIDSAREGFIEGRVHPDDIDGMIKLLRRFHNISYLSNAIYYWSQGDSIVTELIPISEQLKEQMKEPVPSQKILDSLLQRVDIINGDVTKLEDNFSYTLGVGSRWMEHLIMEILFCVALTVEITGLTFSLLVSRSITRGLNEITKTADKIKRGDLAVRATVFSKDEIGQVATSINQMAEQLILSNQELSHFAYIASHDLQEPLRKISVFTNLLEAESKDVLSEKGSMYMEKILKSSQRMQQLIEDILQLSRLSTTPDEFDEVNLNTILTQVIADFEIILTRSNTIIHSDELPLIEANALQMGQLFQNLLGNAIKFNNKRPEITISYEIINGDQLPDKYWATVPYKFTNVQTINNTKNEKFCKIYFKDNGIGFDEQYLERIFVIFQRLNSKNLYEGSGIGLAVSHRIVTNHHGIITAQSTPDIGSVFIVTLPVSQKNFNPKTYLG